MAKEQMRSLQEKQSLALKTQQGQCEMLMRQLQSQMETEMKLKSELVRNQMQILAESSTNNNDLNEAAASLANGYLNNNNNHNANSHVAKDVKEREERLKVAHEQEIEEMQNRYVFWFFGLKRPKPFAPRL